MRLLLVEDEPGLREPLAERLRGAGYTVDTAADGREGLYLASEYAVDLAIVDLGLPQLSGMELIRRLREAGRHYPIIILTARDRWQDKVEGLEAGGDDYLVKPFQVEELLARVAALLRRAAGFSQSLLRCGPILLDPRAQQVRLHDAPLELTAFEYRLLEYLMFHPGEMVSKSTLAEHLYDQDQDRDSNVIEVLIGRLRKKLDPDNSLLPIETLRGRGYRFALERA